MASDREVRDREVRDREERDHKKKALVSGPDMEFIISGKYLSKWGKLVSRKIYLFGDTHKHISNCSDKRSSLDIVEIFSGIPCRFFFEYPPAEKFETAVKVMKFYGYEAADFRGEAGILFKKYFRDVGKYGIDLRCTEGLSFALILPHIEGHGIRESGKPNADIISDYRKKICDPLLYALEEYRKTKIIIPSSLNSSIKPPGKRYAYLLKLYWEDIMNGERLSDIKKIFSEFETSLTQKDVDTIFEFYDEKAMEFLNAIDQEEIDRGLDLLQCLINVGEKMELLLIQFVGLVVDLYCIGKLFQKEKAPSESSKISVVFIGSAHAMMMMDLFFIRLHWSRRTNMRIDSSGCLYMEFD